MQNIKSLLKLSVVLSSLTVTASSFANEAFQQNGNTYTVQEGVFGVINAPESTQQGQPGSQKAKSQGSNAKKHNQFFSVYDAQGLKQHGSKLAKSQKYQVVTKKTVNPRTNKVKEVSALMSGQIIVQAKEVDSVNTSLRLKKSFPKTGFYVYELKKGQSVASALDELNSSPSVESAKVEIIENLRIPM